MQDFPLCTSFHLPILLPASLYAMPCICRRQPLIFCCFWLTIRKYRTASDIVEFRKIKANLVSVNVDRLVSEGYLIREAAPSDRRKTLLFCTEKAAPIIEKGRALQMHFMDALMTGIDEGTKEIIINGLKQMEENLDQLPEEAFTI